MSGLQSRPLQQATRIHRPTEPLHAAPVDIIHALYVLFGSWRNVRAHWDRGSKKRHRLE